MSAFQVSKATLNTIVAGMAASSHIMPVLHMLPEWMECRTNDGCRDLFVQMAQMNVTACNARYSDTSGSPWTSEDYRPMRCPQAFQLLKAVDCLLYQCSEGDVPNDPLFKRLDAWRRKLQDAILCGMPEYNDAHWDIPD